MDILLNFEQTPMMNYQSKSLWPLKWNQRLVGGPVTRFRNQIIWIVGLSQAVNYACIEEEAVSYNLFGFMEQLKITSS